MYTEKQVADAIEDAEVNEDYDDDDYEEWEWGYSRSLVIDGVKVDIFSISSTGGMDKGSSASWVFKIGTQFFKKEGYYQSHYGYDWDGDLAEVKPVEKTITVYERLT